MKGRVSDGGIGLNFSKDTRHKEELFSKRERVQWATYDPGKLKDPSHPPSAQGSSFGRRGMGGGGRRYLTSGQVEAGKT